MIDINEQFETSTMTDVEFAALETFAEAGLDLFYLKDVHEELREHGHWLVQLQYCYNKMSMQNFFNLAKKLNYDYNELNAAFKTICRK
jgi:hypothetical protein